MKLLITGASGFIGSYAVKAAMARGWDVASLDMRHPQEHRRMDCRLLKRIEADCVLHLGAYSSNAGFADDLSENYANNVFGLWNVLRLARGTRVVYASSSAVYGPNREIRECADKIGSGIVVEQAHSHYCRSKRINELMAASYPNTLGLRIFNAYGPGDEMKPVGRQAPPTWMQTAKRAGEPMVIYGDGTQAKDFIHISDVAEIIMRLIESDAIGIVNVGTGAATSFCDLARMVWPEAYLGNVEYRPIPDLASYQFFTRADTTRLLSIVGPYKFVTVKEGLA